MYDSPKDRKIRKPVYLREEGAMAWIKVIQPGETENDRLRTFYKKYSDPFEGIDNILKIHSLNPDSMWKHYDYFKLLTTGRSGLSRMQREMLAIVVSAANDCEYGVTHHREALHVLTQNESLCDAVAGDYTTADVPEKDIAMMKFAEVLTRNPSGVARENVEELRSAGFKDHEILDIVQVAAYYNFMNRMAQGLGVELEPRFRDD
jgi:uncharacterized peroxidase-related enzyme